jgi:GMP synthase (glutamine-hydrolysing)
MINSSFTLICTRSLRKRFSGAGNFGRLWGMHSSVLILDFGSQFTQLIARRIRELGVYSEIKPCTTLPSEIDTNAYQALILSGGPASVRDADAPSFDPDWLKLGLPTLGICYGMQLVAHLFGGKLAAGQSREYGRAELEIVAPRGIFAGFAPHEKTTVWMSHGDHVESLPKGYTLLAQSHGAPIAAMCNEITRTYCVQFHPEVVHTAAGKTMLSNFLFEVANVKPDWTPGNFIEEQTEKLRAEVSDDANVICGLSGGVDSTVAAALVHRAIGKRLTCIFVDNGLLRKDEAKEVVELLGNSGLGLNLVHVDATHEFLSELKGVTDPEQKRKIIGRVFVEVFEREAHKISKVSHLVQGTLYPDVIESFSVRGPSATIKTHHNVGGLPEKLQFKLIEPLRELFKDEVRLIGKDLQVPPSILTRQPFPGPGLAVRILGDITAEKLALLKDADKIFMDEIRAAGLYETLWQSFAVLLPVKSVGVMGDGRTYEQAICLRAVHSDDGMTADWAYLPHDLLQRVSNRIINTVKGINRVVLDISSKPPATIEWE